MKNVAAVLVLFLFVLLMFPVAFAQMPLDSISSDTMSLPSEVTVAVEATPVSGPTLLDQIASLLAALTPIMGILVAIGLGTKYLPFMSKVPNMLIPFLNTVVAFLAVFAGPAPANAGIFGDFVHSLSFPVKAAGSAFLAVGARLVYETYLRGILEKFGIYASGLSKAELAAKSKLTDPIGGK